MTTPLYAVFFSRQALADPLLLRLMTTPLYAVFFSRQGPLPGAWVVLPVVGEKVVVETGAEVVKFPDVVVKFPAVVVAVGATVVAVGATVVGATVVGATVVGASVEKDQSQVPVSSPSAAIPNLFSLITRALSSRSLPVVWPMN